MNQSFRRHIFNYRKNAKYVMVLVMCFTTLACSTSPSKQSSLSDNDKPLYDSSRLIPDDIGTPLDVWDPLEPMNRSIYKFNAQFDDYIYLPIVSTYQTITPDFMESAISNFFNNLDDIRTFVNQVLQLKPIPAIETTSSFLVNSTIGILGLIDVADYFGIPQHEEDFGQTLGHYGVPNGPYLVVPVLGPSTLRDSIATFPDTFVTSSLLLDDHPDRKLAVYPLRFLDQRANIAFRYFETGSPFEYELIRLLYTTKRDIEINK